MSDRKMVYIMGDGSTLCEDCLSDYLADCGEPNSITCGVETDADGLPVYGWTDGTCTQCTTSDITA